MKGKGWSPVLNFISPYIRWAQDGVVPLPWRLRERVIFDYELVFVKEGELIVTVEDSAYHGIPSDIFLFKPRQRHSMRIIGNTPLRQLHIHFDMFYKEDSPDVKVSFNLEENMSPVELNWFREDVTSSPPMLLPNHFRFKNAANLEKLFFQVIREYNMKLPFHSIACRGAFIQLWTELLRENYWIHNPNAASNWEELKQLQAYMNTHSDKELTLQALSDEVKLSKFHLIKLFKLTFGMTPVQYHNLLRMERAKELIQFTSLPITEIAEKLGYQNIHAFSRAFKSIEGVSPSFYRRKG